MTETSGNSHLGGILVVDDVPDNLRLLTDILKAQGYKARPVPNGRLALRAARNDPPDLILLDVDMPEMNGLEVCRQLKADGRTRDIPVIFISALGNTADVVKGLRAGGIDYIVKPFQAEEVLAHVQTHLSLRRLQRQLQERNAQLQEQAEALARANAARLKDEFLASMSHELRTPLNAILGMSEVLCDGVYGPLNENQLRSVRTIEGSGRHLLDLINDILDVAKIEASKEELELAPVSVGSVCEASLGLIKQNAHKKQLKVSTVLDSAATVLRADERRLKQILVNLLTNAVKFTPEGGSIGLEVAGDAERGAVHFTVWDTGIGIAAEDMERLFQPFLQLDSRLSREHTGTGLGLSLVQRLAEMHGGGVSVESEVGKGSRFTVSLPWQETDQARKAKGESPQDTEPREEPAMPGGQPSAVILLAEDNESSVSTFFDYLQAKGYRVIVARNGNEAIDLARDGSPDLILMDVQMPGMDGLEATRRIRADADPSTGLRTKLADVPIIALTALAMPGDRERCLEAGVNEYLSKPVSLRQLVDVIEVQIEESMERR
jgi:signal transduction histidine kinase